MNPYTAPLAEMRFALGICVLSGIVGVTVFGIFLTPVFYFVMQWFAEKTKHSPAWLSWITTPLISEMVAVGKTPAQLSEDIRTVLAQYIQDPLVSVMVDRPQGTFAQQIRIVGATERPAALPYRANMTLLDAMIAVGGLSEFAAGDRARLIRFDRASGRQRRPAGDAGRFAVAVALGEDDVVHLGRVQLRALHQGLQCGRAQELHRHPPGVADARLFQQPVEGAGRVHPAAVSLERTSRSMSVVTVARPGMRWARLRTTSLPSPRRAST